ncbi:MAG TPA: D-alanyl-D-alanine carboxypeptidase/D-alanyl-D-alanine-endopeptidase [Acidimicrobiales bacterium]|nr:D-alanyl-D-alanine carboxypeptidase/D-alanyl-D-alanine-endopeptidase [Acidimicrobiales bacterium]
MNVRAVAVALALLCSPPVAVQAQEAPPTPPSPALATPVFSVRRVPDLLSREVADTHLAADLDRIFGDPVYAGGRERSCLVVGDPGGGRVHYARNDSLSLIPASTMKVMTSAAALAQLGPQTRFTTEVRAGGAPSDGAVGDLYLVGGGDPLLSTADFAADGGYMGQPRRSTSIETLADKVVAAGVRRVGRLLGDESRYDSERLVPSWNPRYIVNFDISPISALVVDKAFSSTTPPAVAVSPPAHAASVLAGLLRARGVTVGDTGTGKAPGGAPLVTSIQSEPLTEIVAEVLQNSDNLAAEMLVKEMGTRPGSPGSTTAGLAAMAERLRQLAGVTGEDMTAVDGSGLDRTDRLTCSVLQRVVAQAGDAGPLTRGLPEAGRNGTLFRRFLGTPAAGRIRAKTGSLEGVVALSGYATGQGGRSIAFSLLANELPSNSAGAGLQDRVANVLAGYPRAPSPDELGPKAPAG